MLIPLQEKKVRIKLIFWFEKERHNHTTGVLTAGTYAKFEYTGSIKTTFIISIMFI